MKSEEVEQADSGDGEVQERNYEVIPVQLVEAYENVALPSSNSSNNISHGNTSNKGRYYKQTYRPAWEQMPDFKGWLRGVEGEPTRAFCTYCHKTLHAHRLSLLKHTCTIRHLKAAQIYSAKKNKSGQEKKTDREVGANEDVLMGENEDSESPDMEDGDTEHENDDDEGDEGEDGEESSAEFQIVKKESVQKTNITELPPISTQVTDMSKGRPISGLQVSLYKLIDGRWTYINEGLTNINGSFSQFLERCDFMPGRYKLHYDVDRYFDAKKQNTIFPFVETVFDCTTFSESHHIPLLLGPYGYTTYKG